MKKYELVDFRSMQGFQSNWKTQTELSRAQQDMTTACLFHFNLSLPAMVRWIAGPHISEHCDNEESTPPRSNTGHFVTTVTSIHVSKQIQPWCQTRLF
jgi:hypothetical protein